MDGVRRVGLPTPGFPSSPKVWVVNGVGQQLGLIGLISTGIVRSNRSDAVVSMMAAKQFDPRAAFQDELTGRLQKLGLTPVPEAADGTRSSFIKEYPGPGTDDAALDVYVSAYGFFAASDSDDSPYRPGVALSMRLVSARDRSVLMQDQVTNTGIDAPVAAAAGGAVPPSFTTFSDVMANPELAITALRLAFSYAADTVGSRLA